MEFYTRGYQCLFYILFFVVCLGGCVPQPDGEPILSRVSFLQLCPGVFPLDVYVNKEVEQAGFPYGSQSGSTASPYLFFVKVSTDPWHLRVTPAGLNTTLIDTVPAWQTDKRYSVVVYDSLPKPKLLILEDDASVAPTGRARIRFVHVVHNRKETPLTLTLDTNNVRAYNIQSVAYATASAYVEVLAGSYRLNATTGTGSLAEVGYPVSFQSRKSYTLYGRGVAGVQYPATNAFKVSTVLHN